MASGKYLKTKEQRLKIAFKMKENFLGRKLTEEEKSSYVLWADTIIKGGHKGRRKGFIMSVSHRNAISKSMRKIFGNFGDIVNPRSTFEYKKWRQDIFKRDNFTCQICGFKSKGTKPSDIHADHIKPFALFKELRLSLENGRTLCIPCHRNTDTFLNGTRELARKLLLTSFA